MDTLSVAYIGVVIASVVLNLMRGDDRWMGTNQGKGDTKGWLPGRPAYYVAPLMGLVTYLFTWDWKLGLAFGLGYLIWALPAWGRTYDLGNLPPEAEPRDFLDRILFGLPDHLALFLRHAICLLPLGLFLGWYLGWHWLGLPVVLGGALLLCYVIGWAVSRSNAITIAEGLSGLAWAAAIIATRLV